MQCLKCRQETSNPKFCSQSCAASFNNRKFPKRSPEGTCIKCPTKVPTTRKYCKRCLRRYRATYDFIPLSKVCSKYRKYAPSAAYNIIRQRARRALKLAGRTVCEVCGYSKHFEAAHIKPIGEFAPETLIGDINHSSNLVALCPTHHWEFDHGLLQAVREGFEPSM